MFGQAYAIKKTKRFIEKNHLEESAVEIEESKATIPINTTSSSINDTESTRTHKRKVAYGLGQTVKTDEILKSSITNAMKHLSKDEEKNEVGAIEYIKEKVQEKLKEKVEEKIEEKLTSRKKDDTTASVNSTGSASRHKKKAFLGIGQPGHVMNDERLRSSLSKAQRENIEEQRKNGEGALEYIQEIVSQQEQRENDVAQKIRETKASAKQKLDSGNKRAALRHMKKAKMYEYELNKVGRAIETLEMQTLSIESSLNQMDVITAMLEGKNAMQKIEKGTKIEDVDKLLDEIRDSMDYSKEIEAMLGEPIVDTSIIVDDEELLRELEEYEPINQDTMLVDKLPSAPDLPNKRTNGFWNAFS